MKTKAQKKKRFKVVGGVIAVLLLITIGSGIAVAKAQGVSLKDAIANVAGNILGNKLAGEIDGGELSLGAFAGPEITSPFLVFNGVEKWTFSQRFNKASSTLCQFKVPVSATTTLVYAMANFNTATATAVEIEWGKSPAQSATTTSLGQHLLAAGTNAVFVASTTLGSLNAINVGGSNNADPIFVIAPENYVALKWTAAATDETRHDIAGNCVAEFIVN